MRWGNVPVSSPFFFFFFSFSSPRRTSIPFALQLSVIAASWLWRRRWPSSLAHTSLLPQDYCLVDSRRRKRTRTRRRKREAFVAAFCLSVIRPFHFTGLYYLRKDREGGREGSSYLFCMTTFSDSECFSHSKKKKKRKKKNLELSSGIISQSVSVLQVCWSLKKKLSFIFPL